MKCGLGGGGGEVQRGLRRRKEGSLRKGTEDFLEVMLFEPGLERDRIGM